MEIFFLHSRIWEGNLVTKLGLTFTRNSRKQPAIEEGTGRVLHMGIGEGKK
jgi:hypothetical protein